jgi:hypothetical protein
MLHVTQGKCSFHHGINCSPYEAIFVTPLHNGLADSSPASWGISRIMKEVRAENFMEKDAQVLNDV